MTSTKNQTSQAKKATELKGIPQVVNTGGIEIYRYDIRNKDERDAYDGLALRLKGEGYQLHRSWGGKHLHRVWGERVKVAHPSTMLIDMAHPFDNQWDTAETNMRVHEWAEDYAGGSFGISQHIRQGYYLTGLEELREYLGKLSKCGYCGNFGLTENGGHCQACVGSAYLKAEDLHLLVMSPVRGPERSKSQVAALMPQLKELWLERQLSGPVSNNPSEVKTAEMRASAEQCRQKAEAYEKAAVAWEWLIARNINTENIIFYDHSMTFSVGWRADGISEDLAALWREKLKDFPAKWEVKVKGPKS